MPRANMVHEATNPAEARSPSAQGFADYDIVLQPVSHPDLDDICIEENLFAIGRTEPPFDSYPPEVVAELSRRHARIFCEYGAVYIADLDSKNGTTLNGVDIQQKISRLHDGDEICFGRSLVYRVRLGSPAQTQRHATKLLSLTLTPQKTELGLQPIVVTRFPFLISKADDAFARYKNDYPHQVHYLSRRHAHIFLKGGLPYVEDLGSTNGTFVNGKRLDEHAVALADDDVLAFGGHHFVYVISLQQADAQIDPTVTMISEAATGAAPAVARAGERAGESGAAGASGEPTEKTTFVTAADTFLDIFCVDQGAQAEEEAIGEEEADASAAREAATPRRSRGRVATLLGEFRKALRDEDQGKTRHWRRWSAAAVGAVAAVAAGIYFSGSGERELKNLMEAGDYQRAAAVADASLQDKPGNTELQALGTEALLKANLPQWLAALKARDFERAAGIIGNMKQAGRHNPDALALANELAWLGNLERFVASRSAPDTPIRIYADEERIKALLKYWDEDTQGHQRALTRIASYVPDFKEPYAAALSHLRRLQSDNAVYLAAIERLKTAIATQLNRDRAETLVPMLDEYAEKYPRIGGLDTVRSDLKQYLAIDQDARDRNLGSLAARLPGARFATPPFQARMRDLTAVGRLPSADLLQRYAAVSKAWDDGDAKTAFAGLQKIAGAGGPWSDGASRDLAHKQAVSEQFGVLQKARNAKGYDERLFAFCSLLDPERDRYFAQAVQPDLGAQKSRMLQRAQDRFGRAEALWRQYQEEGGIDAGQRLEAGVSEKFRAQAQLLSQAQEAALQGARVEQLLKVDYQAQWGRLVDDIRAEMNLQRKSLQDAQGTIQASILRTKLVLLGG